MLRKYLLCAAALLSSSSSALGRTFFIRNQCPEDITYFINGESQGTIAASGGQVQNDDIADEFSGFIYTDANGGDQSGVGTTRAGFFLEEGYYYLVIDPSHFNTGVSIITDSGVRPGFCVAALCVSAYCPDVYDRPPTDFPPPSRLPPNRPLYRCTNPDAIYKVTFCPDNQFPLA